MKKLLVLSLCGIACLYAQINTASLSGLVTDPSQAVVSGVHVSARNKSTGVRREVLTNATGYYSFATLPVGDYEITVQKNGHSQTTHQTLIKGPNLWTIVFDPGP